jgi:ketosteroid isomerase-like protein
MAQMVRTKSFTMYLYILLFPVLSTLTFAEKNFEDKAQQRKALAERYFQGIYQCDLSVIDELVDENVIVSYPIFETLINTPTNQGREAVKDFHSSFCKRWTDPQLTIHESIAEGDKVVLIWSFKARNKASLQRGDPDDKQIQSWGGITVLHFDESNKIVAEFGEESQPGPYGRLKIIGPGR